MHKLDIIVYLGLCLKSVFIRGAFSQWLVSLSEKKIKYNVVMCHWNCYNHGLLKLSNKRAFEGLPYIHSVGNFRFKVKLSCSVVSDALRPHGL